MKFLKSYRKRKDEKNYKQKLLQFSMDCINKLFDIASCKCRDTSKCKCEKTKKNPIKERAFLEDQRSLRKMYIGDVNISETKKLNKGLKEKESR